jgi:methylthioribulose-1-phosphate dehydratase
MNTIEPFDLLANGPVFTEVSTTIVNVSQRLYQHGWSPATSSNYSHRLDDHHCAVTVSGKDKGLLCADDVMVVDMAGQAAALFDDAQLSLPNSAKKPSAETLLHTQIYGHFPAVGAVLHTHSVAATVLSLHQGDSIRFENYEVVKAFSAYPSHEEVLTLPVFENNQNIPALAAEVAQWLATADRPVAYVIRGHGVYTWAPDMQSCYRHIEALEFLFECELRRLALQR